MCEILAKPGFDIMTSLEGFSGEREREREMGFIFVCILLLIFILGETYQAARFELARTGLPDIPQRKEKERVPEREHAPYARNQSGQKKK
jgi:hypothetical protein